MLVLSTRRIILFDAEPTRNNNNNNNNRRSVAMATLHSEMTPPPTRHRGILTFSISPPLYDFRNCSEKSLVDLKKSSENAAAVMLVSAVGTRSLSNFPEHDEFCKLDVIFYGERRGDATTETCCVAIPKDWPPNMFLFAVNQSIRQHGMVFIEQVRTKDTHHLCINEINWLYYTRDAHVVLEELQGQCAHFDVEGGTTK